MPLPENTTPLAYRPPEVAALVALSRSRIYELIASGALPSVKVGRTRLVRHVDLVAFLDALGQAS